LGSGRGVNGLANVLGFDRAICAHRADYLNTRPEQPGCNSLVGSDSRTVRSWHSSTGGAVSGACAYQVTRWARRVLEILRVGLFLPHRPTAAGVGRVDAATVDLTGSLQG
jgi:hypothetical protein